jgi:hypothetical protein
MKRPTDVTCQVGLCILYMGFFTFAITPTLIGTCHYKSGSSCSSSFLWPVQGNLYIYRVSGGSGSKRVILRSYAALHPELLGEMRDTQPVQYYVR